jgi:ATP-dependent Clp protease ATP-binding subunit ClpA
MWGSLVRRLVRTAISLGIRHVAQRRQRGGGRRPPHGGVTVIDVQPVGPFDRFSEPARRAVARAASLHDDAVVTVPSLLLGVLDTHRPSAVAVERAGVDLGQVRAAVTDSLATASTSAAASPATREVLRAAERGADRRGSFRVEPHDLLTAVTQQPAGLASVLDQETVAALRRVTHDGDATG